MRILPATVLAFSCLPLAVHAQPLLSSLDPSAVEAGYAGQMAFDRTPGDLEVSDFQFHALLPRILPSAEGWTILPVFDYGTTILRFNGVPTSLPVDPENVESFNVYTSVLSLSTFALSSRNSSPWVYGCWGRVQLASDFQKVDSDDLTFDLASGIGYRFNDRLTFGLGAMVTDLNGNQRFLPGIGLDWAIHDDLHVTACGTEWRISWSPGDIWRVSLRGVETGEIWNIQDDQRKSRSIDFRSYRIGLFSNRKLAGHLELQTGVGATLMNEISLASPGGRTLIRQGTDQGVFCELGLNLIAW